MSETEHSAVLEEVSRLLCDTLQLNRKARALTAESRLLGHIPELDSMAVVSVITAVEERFGFVVDDDEISADTFATLGSLVRFVEKKIEA